MHLLTCWNITPNSDIHTGFTLKRQLIYIHEEFDRFPTFLVSSSTGMSSFPVCETSVLCSPASLLLSHSGDDESVLADLPLREDFPAVGLGLLVLLGDFLWPVRVKVNNDNDDLICATNSDSRRQWEILTSLNIWVSKLSGSTGST